MLLRREQKRFNGFQFGTLIGCFLSDSAASMAVKGLRRPVQKQTVQITPFKVQVLLALHSASSVAKKAKKWSLQCMNPDRDPDPYFCICFL